MKTTIEPNPPWIEFAGETFYWAGWKQGSGHPWMVSVFLPFLLAATPSQREVYLVKWPPLDDEWCLWVSQYD
jgi:hypothetical protein